jgi:hypothetical protein
VGFYFHPDVSDEVRKACLDLEVKLIAGLIIAVKKVVLDKELETGAIRIWVKR